MGERLSAWEIGADGQPHSIASAWPTLEAHLEDWIQRDLSLVDPALLYLGRQIPTDLGTVLDVLGIDASGRLAVIELKRGRSPREMVAQALEYAAWAETLSPEDVLSLAANVYAGEEHFRTRFAAAFKVDFPSVDEINREQRIVLVAPEFSETILRVARYLSSRFGVPIAAVSFGLYQVDGAQVLVRSDVVEELNEAPRRPPTESRRTLAELRELANERETLVIVDELLKLRARVLTSTETTLTTISLRRNAGGGRYLSGMSIHFGVDGEDGPLINISPQNLEFLFGSGAKGLLEHLSRLGRPDNNPWGNGWQGWLQYVVPTLNDATSVVQAYEAALAAATASGSVEPGIENESYFRPSDR